jgi:hypothetical protein
MIQLATLIVLATVTSSPVEDNLTDALFPFRTMLSATQATNPLAQADYVLQRMDKKFGRGSIIPQTGADNRLSPILKKDSDAATYHAALALYDVANACLSSTVAGSFTTL